MVKFLCDRRPVIKCEWPDLAEDFARVIKRAHAWGVGQQLGQVCGRWWVG
jgi:hypothetical protein